MKSLKIAKIDATRNEVEGIQITAFPTVLLFPAGKNKPHVGAYEQLLTASIYVVITCNLSLKGTL